VPLKCKHQDPRRYQDTGGGNSHNFDTPARQVESLVRQSADPSSFLRTLPISKYTTLVSRLQSPIDRPIYRPPNVPSPYINVDVRAMRNLPSLPNGRDPSVFAMATLYPPSDVLAPCPYTCVAPPGRDPVLGGEPILLPVSDYDDGKVLRVVVTDADSALKGGSNVIGQTDVPVAALKAVAGSNQEGWLEIKSLDGARIGGSDVVAMNIKMCYVHDGGRPPISDMPAQPQSQQQAYAQNHHAGPYGNGGGYGGGPSNGYGGGYGGGPSNGYGGGPSYGGPSNGYGGPSQGGGGYGGGPSGGWNQTGGGGGYGGGPSYNMAGEAPKNDRDRDR
jgi:hypothetical protein